MAAAVPHVLEFLVAAAAVVVARAEEAAVAVVIIGRCDAVIQMLKQRHGG